MYAQNYTVCTVYIDGSTSMSYRKTWPWRSPFRQADKGKANKPQRSIVARECYVMAYS